METSSLAYVFQNSNHSDDEIYPFLEEEATQTPLSPEEQELLLGVYPATLSDLDFAATLQALPATTQHQLSQQQSHHQHQQPHYTPPDMRELNISGENGSNSTTGMSHDRSKMPGLLPPSPSMVNGHQQQHYNLNGHQQHPTASTSSPYFDARSLQAFQSHPRNSQHKTSSSPTLSPSSAAGSDDVALRDSEEILNAPVKSLTEEEKKLRRRAQVAKSARKHRNRQKEELARLREQVQFLQEQMATMMHHDGPESADSIKHEKEVITQHRKRKKADDMDIKVEEDDLTITSGNSLQTMPGSQMAVTAPIGLRIEHWFHHLPVDTLQRTTMLHQIADKRVEMALHYLHSEFGGRVVTYPSMDIKLNSNGPDMEVKVLRAKQVPGFTHQEVAEATWKSIYNFQFDVPERFRQHVKSERLMELDENTRYGRTIVPILRVKGQRDAVYLHSYFLIRRQIQENYIIITWETIDLDDLYPFETSDTALCNDEVGCTIFETETLPNGEVQTLFRSILHSTPPVSALAEPRGKINQAFLTLLCRNADVLESSTRKVLDRNHPERVSKPEIVA